MLVMNQAGRLVVINPAGRLVQVLGKLDDRLDLDLLDRLGELGHVVEVDGRSGRGMPVRTTAETGAAAGAAIIATISVSSGISVSIRLTAPVRLRRISASACSRSSRAVGMPAQARSERLNERIS